MVARTYMQERLALFSAHLGVGIAEHEADRSEEVALAGAITPHNNVVSWGKGLDHGLFFVATLAVSSSSHGVSRCLTAKGGLKRTF